MMGSETKDFLKEEVDRLYQVIENEAGLLTADGGQLGSDILAVSRKLAGIGWLSFFFTCNETFDKHPLSLNLCACPVKCAAYFSGVRPEF